MKQFNRINNPQTIDKEFIKAEISNGKEVIVQFSEPIYSNELLSENLIYSALKDESFPDLITS